jgi:hypothetical protein
MVSAWSRWQALASCTASWGRSSRLNADSRATANTVKWAVFAELKVIIDRAGRDIPQGDNLIREALELATHRVTVRDGQELAQLRQLSRRASIGRLRSGWPYVRLDAAYVKVRGNHRRGKDGRQRSCP